MTHTFESNRHTFHLVLLHPARACVLISATGDRWSLPYIAIDAYDRVVPHLTTFMQARGLNGSVVHEACLESGDRPYTDWYCLIVVDETSPQTAPLEWRLLGKLEPRLGAWPAQAHALAACGTRLSSPSAAFDTPAQIDAANRWLEREVRRLGGQLLSPPRPHRIGRHERVASIDTTIGSIYFKGGRRRFSAEGLLLRDFHAALPSHFPPVLAMNVEEQWFLVGGACGAPLRDSLIDVGMCDTFARALALVQQQVLKTPSLMTRLAQRALTAATLYGVRERVVSVLDARRAEFWSVARRHDLERLLDCAIAAIATEDVPVSWVSADLWGANVLAHASGVCFIDIEDSYLGNPALALYRCYEDLCFRCRADSTLLNRLESVFAEAWEPTVSRATMQTSLAAALICGGLLLLKHRWDYQHDRRATNGTAENTTVTTKMATYIDHWARHILDVASVAPGISEHLRASRR